MGLGDILGSLFGGKKNQASSGAAAVTDTLEYNGYTIEAAPIADGGQHRTAGFITGELDGEQKRVQFIRADTSPDKEQATSHAIAKAKQIIDEQGSGLLKRDNL